MVSAAFPDESRRRAIGGAEVGMGLGRRLASDTLVYGTAYAVSRALSFILLPIFTRALGAAEFGAYDLAMSLGRALSVPALLGMDNGVGVLMQRRDAEGQRRAASSCWAALAVVNGLLGLVVVLAAPWLSLVLFGARDEAALVVLAELFAITFILSYFAVNLTKWKREPGRYLLLAAGSVALASAFSLALVLIWAQGSPGALAGMAVGYAVFIPVGFFVCRRHLGRQIALGDMIDCIRLGLPFATITAAELLVPLLIRAMLSKEAGLAAVGVFGAANTICLGIMLANEGFASAWWPYALSAEGADRAREDTAEVIRHYAFFLILLVAAVTLLAEPAVRILLGRGDFYRAAAIVGPLAFGYWFKSVRHNATVVLIVAGQIWTRALLNLVALATTLALAYPLIALWGLEGAAWGFALGEAIGLGSQAIVLRRAHAQRIDVLSLAIAAALFALLLLASRALVPASAGGAVMLRVVLGAAFLGGLLAVHLRQPRGTR